MSNSTPSLKDIFDAISTINIRLVGIDTRLNGIDIRLNGIDTRLNDIDIKLEAHTEQFRLLNNKVDLINKKLLNLEETVHYHSQQLKDTEDMLFLHGERLDSIATKT